MSIGGYRVKFLNWDAFDKLSDSNPRYENTRDSMAFADPETNTAYIRRTPSALFDGITAMHEIEHLVNKDDLHMDEHGIQHKKFFKEAVRNVAAASLAPFTGGLSLSAGTKDFREKTGDIIPREITQEGPLGGFSTLAPDKPLGRAVKGATPALLTAGAILGGNVLGGFGAGAGGTTGAPAGSVGVGLGGPTASAGVGAGAGGGALGAGVGSSASSIVGGITNITSKALSSLSSVGKQLLGAGTSTSSSAAATNTSKFGLGGLGGLTPLVGLGLLAKSANVDIPEPPPREEFLPPTQSEATERLLGRSASVSGITPTGTTATKELDRIISSPFGEAFGPYNDPYVEEAKRQNEINYFGDPGSGVIGLRDRVINRYNNLGHYEGRSGELDAALSKLDQDYMRQQNQLDQEAQFRASEFEKSQRFAAIQQALGIDEAQVRDLINLANIDISIAALKYGISVEDAKSIRDLFGKAGGLAIGASILGGA